MVRQYATKAFLRQSPNLLLTSYFDTHSLLVDVDIDSFDLQAIRTHSEYSQMSAEGDYNRVRKDRKA